MTGDTNKTRTAFCLRVQTPIPAASTGFVETLSDLTQAGAKESGGPASRATEASAQWPRHARPPALRPHTRPASPALPSPLGSLAWDTPTPEGALPVPGAAAFPEELSSPLSVLPMMFQPVPFSSWPLALPSLQTSPHEPRCPGRARTLRSPTQPDGREAASETSQVLGSCALSSPRVPATGSETS